MLKTSTVLLLYTSRLVTIDYPWQVSCSLMEHRAPSWITTDTQRSKLLLFWVTTISLLSFPKIRYIYLTVVKKNWDLKNCFLSFGWYPALIVGTFVFKISIKWTIHLIHEMRTSMFESYIGIGISRLTESNSTNCCLIRDSPMTTRCNIQSDLLIGAIRESCASSSLHLSVI